MKKITFIYPAIGKKSGKKYIKTWKMEPLPIASLAGLTPSDLDLEFYDDRLELINYDTQTDFVAITVETYTAKRAYYIAEQFQKRNIPVVLGGYHPTHLPDEAGQFADTIITGNAEHTWPQLINDFKAGKLKPIYSGITGYNHSLPDRSIFKGKNI